MNATATSKPLGQLLIGRGFIRQDQLERALDEQRQGRHEKLLGEILVELRDCTEEQVAEALAESYGVPFARITPRLVDPKVVPVLPRAFVEKHGVLPLFLVDGELTVAVSEPADVFLVEEIERISGTTAHIVAATQRDIRATLNAYHCDDGAFALDALIEETPAESLQLVRASGEAVELPEPPDAPAAKLVRYCLCQAVSRGAAAVHFEPDGDSLRVRLRIDGAMVELTRTPMRLAKAVSAQLKAAAGLDPSQLLPQENGFAAIINGKATQLHVGNAAVRGGERLLVRVGESRKPAFGFEQLGFGYDMLKSWRRLLGRPSGLIVVAGSVSSGHHTTLYSSLEFRSSADVSCCTVENPIRYAIPGISQFEVDQKRDFDTATALAAVLSQDPDVIMTTNLPDSDSAELAARAALNGRLVLAGVHAPDAPSALARLMNLGIEPYVAGSTVAGVLAQRLVRRLCPSCREAHEPPAAQRRLLEHYGHTGGVLYRPKGCDRCNKVGYLGRVGIFELLVPDDAMTERLSRQVTLPELRELARQSGMKPLRADGLEKVKAGITTLDEVGRVTG